MVTIAGNPSGIAETASATAIMNISMTGIPSIIPTRKITAHAARATIPRYFPKDASFFCNGVCVLSSLSRRFATRPISVSIPVAVTTAIAVPYVMEQPVKTMLVRSPRGAFSLTVSSASFSEGTDSPVRAASSDFKLDERISLASAGIKSPASSLMISPGTSKEASIICSTPSLITLALGEERFLRASKAFSALLSCNTPITALSITISIISTGSKNSFASFS